LVLGGAFDFGGRHFHSVKGAEKIRKRKDSDRCSESFFREEKNRFSLTLKTGYAIIGKDEGGGKEYAGYQNCKRNLN
jgi:hypothetical protein